MLNSLHYIHCSIWRARQHTGNRFGDMQSKQCAVLVRYSRTSRTQIQIKKAKSKLVATRQELARHQEESKEVGKQLYRFLHLCYRHFLAFCAMVAHAARSRRFQMEKGLRQQLSQSTCLQTDFH